MGTWLNDDGLYIKYGTTEAVPTKTGEYSVMGQYRISRATIDWEDLAVFSTVNILSDTMTIPAGAIIHSAELYVETAFTSGGAATFDVGLIDQDRVTEIDYDGFDAAIAVGSMSDAATVAGDGALVGTVLTNTGLLVARVNVADFTAGQGTYSVKWYVPDA